MTHGEGIVIRRMAWQIGLALLGIALTFFILSQLVAEQITVEQPATGGTYIEGLLGYSRMINPILAPLVVQTNPVDQDLSALVFDGLTTFDETGRVSPALATEWDVSDDGTVYAFRLRRDVVWHDQAPFTAADVAFTIQALQDPDYQGDPGLQELWRSVTVEQLGDYEVQFTLAEPFPSFLSYTVLGVLPAHLLSDVPAAELPTHSFSTRRPVGTGMFMVDSVSTDRVILVVNPQYWGPKPYLEQLEFWLYGDEDDLLVDFTRGEIHGFHPMEQKSLTALSKMPNAQLYSALSARYGIVYLNLRSDTLPFFREKEVRQALLMALDRPLLINDALGGQGLVADSPILPTSWAHDPTIRQYRYDPQRAIGLLDATGWIDSDGDGVRDRDGISLAFTLLASEELNMVDMAETIARAWQDLGIDASVEIADAAQVPSEIRARSYDAALTEFSLLSDPDPYPFWHSSQAEEPGQNFSGFSNEQADLLMEAGRKTVDQEELTGIYRSFQQIFAEEVPSLLLYYPIYNYAVDRKVRDVQLPPLLHTSDRFRNISQWYVETNTIVVTEQGGLDKTE